jgi:hypothetical protein
MLGAWVLNQQVTSLNPYDYEEVDVGGTAVGLTASKVNGCQAARIRFTDGAVSFRVDGQADPTASVGIPVYDGDTQDFSRLEAKQLKMIRIDGAANGKARVTYYK